MDASDAARRGVCGARRRHGPGVDGTRTLRRRRASDTPPVSVNTTVTTNPATSLPAGSPLTDEQLVAAILLDPAELGLSRVEPVRGWEVTDTRDPTSSTSTATRPDRSARRSTRCSSRSSRAHMPTGLWAPSQPTRRPDRRRLPRRGDRVCSVRRLARSGVRPVSRVVLVSVGVPVRRSYGAALRGVGGRLRLLHVRTAGRPDQRRRCGAGGPDVDVRRRFDHVVRASPAVDVGGAVRVDHRSSRRPAKAALAGTLWPTATTTSEPPPPTSASGDSEPVSG